MRRDVRFASAGLAILLVSAPASAQIRFQQAPSLPKGFVSANGSFQPASGSFTEHRNLEQFVETGTIETDFQATPALIFDGMFGLRLWKSFGVGVGISSYAPGARSKQTGTVTAQLPHPFYFNQHREVSGDAGLTHGETAVHANLLYFRQITPKVLAVVGAGPTLFQGEQTFVENVLYEHEYPYDTAVFRGVDRDSETASAFGFNAGLDLSWRFSKSFGIGGVVRYSHATMRFTPGSREVTLAAGGIQAGLGLRALF